MNEKAEATARRIEQTMADLERQISWVTRASSIKIEDRQADYALLLKQVPWISQLSQISGNGRETLRASRQSGVSYGSTLDLSRDATFTDTRARGTNFAPAYFRDAKGKVLASSSKGPELAKDLAGLPQVAAIVATDRASPASGTDSEGHSVLTTSSAVPKLGWHVFYEQPTSQALAPIRDQLVRIALLIAL